MEAPKLNRDELIAKWEHVLQWTDFISTWTSGHELAWLCEAASHATHIGEVGSHHGKSALCMALANPVSPMACIDICENDDTEPTFKKNLRTQIESGQLLFINGTSEVMLNKRFTKPFDLFFIDAGHLEPDVTSDIKHIYPHMASGGILCGHDWRPNDMSDGVNQAVMKAFQRPNVFESIWWIRVP